MPKYNFSIQFMGKEVYAGEEVEADNLDEARSIIEEAIDIDILEEA